MYLKTLGKLEVSSCKEPGFKLQTLHNFLDFSVF